MCTEENTALNMNGFRHYTCTSIYMTNYLPLFSVTFFPLRNSKPYQIFAEVSYMELSIYSGKSTLPINS